MTSSKKSALVFSFWIGWIFTCAMFCLIVVLAGTRWWLFPLVALILCLIDTLKAFHAWEWHNTLDNLAKRLREFTEKMPNHPLSNQCKVIVDAAERLRAANST